MSSNTILIDNLQKQIEALRKADLAVSLPQFQQSPLSNQTQTLDIQALVKAEVAKQLEAVSPKVQPKSTQKNDMFAAALELLGGALSNDHQMLISKNLIKLPPFILSEAGKQACAKFCEEFEVYAKNA